jgi:hypothetical protein
MPAVHRPALLALAFAALVTPGLAPAQDGNLCDVAGESPDIIVGDITNPRRWGETGGITAYSFRTEACNLGTCQADWVNNSDRHPVIAQNVFRLKDGRFEQIGQGWLKHGFATVQETHCSLNCTPSSDNQHLGVNCSDAYTSTLNGTGQRMGPKFEVNPVTGAFPWPPFDFGNSGPTVISKRVQVHDVDVDPAQNPGAAYVVEVQYVARDDAAGGNRHNNASYRKAGVVVPVPGEFDFTLLETTQRNLPAIEAWRAADPGVRLSMVDADGRFYVGVRVTDLGSGRWRYEYAIQNLDSHEAARSFTVPIADGAQITNIGFHDVDYHSGEPFDGTNWPGVVDAGADTVSWSTATFQQNPNANALRWGTLYNFRFDTDSPPLRGPVTIGLFKPSLNTDIVVPDVLVPMDRPSAYVGPYGPPRPLTRPDVPPAVARNGSGVNLPVLVTSSRAVVGRTWHTSIELDGVDDSTLFVSLGGPAGGTFNKFGEILIRTPIDWMSDGFALPIPLEARLVGVPFSAQAAVHTPSGWKLTNALDATIGSN